ncbi:MAG: hypothetical protein IKN49_04815 [Elusimicrobiaceae bacterium]|nr:hypothetical protein [Elusimicrobiaceae bacterium]
MNKIIACILTLSMFFSTTAVMAERLAPLSAEEFDELRIKAMQAYQAGIISPDLDKTTLHHSVHSRKYNIGEISRFTEWKQPDSSSYPQENEKWLDWEIIDMMRDYYYVLGTNYFLGPTYLMLICALTEKQIDELKKVVNPRVPRYAPMVQSEPDWQLDEEKMKKKKELEEVPDNTQILHRLLALQFLQIPYQVLEGSRYNFVHYRQQGMPAKRMAQYMKELPWFNECVQDTLNAVILNHKYSDPSFDLDKMLHIIKEKQDSTTDIHAKIKRQKRRIKDVYIRQYIRHLEERHASWWDYLKGTANANWLSREIDNTAKYCTLVHISAELLQTYDSEQGAEAK